eukprot:809783-Amphidinium_carterae.1
MGAGAAVSRWRTHRSSPKGAPPAPPPVAQRSLAIPSWFPLERMLPEEPAQIPPFADVVHVEIGRRQALPPQSQNL